MRGRIFRLSSPAIPNYPGLVDPQSDADWVAGEVFSLRDPAATLAALDKYEGCAPGGGFFGFVRRLAEAELAAGARVQVWVYPYVWPVEGHPQIVSGDYFRQP